MVHIGRAVGPLVSARQGRRRLALVEALARDGLMLEIRREVAQQRLVPLPIVERGLQRWDDMRGVGIICEIGRNDDQPPVAAALEAGEFHGGAILYVWKSE